MQRIYFFICFFLVFAAAPVMAQTLPPSCESVRNTAEVLGCVKTQYERAQDSLTEAYDGVVENTVTMEPEKLRAAQQDWVTFRDRQCAWEVLHVETESLKRLQELSCLTKLTDARASHLVDFGQEGTIATYKEYYNQPVWANVLASEHPKVFWRYAEKISADLNCDGVDEEIIAGLEPQADPAPSGISAVVAVAENPATGRPRTQFFILPADAAHEGALCYANMSFDPPSPVGEKPEVAENADATKSCNASLVIRDKLCRSLVLHWNGKTYVMEDEADYLAGAVSPNAAQVAPSP